MSIFSIDALQRELDNHNCRQLLLAYSGGMDSHVLLHSLLNCAQQLSLQSIRAIHIDHGLQPQSRQWVEHCQQIAKEYQIELIVCQAQISVEKSQGIEASARKVRYQLFAEHLREGECLLTAHHQDDQAETLLLQLLRGAGVKGLSAMPRWQSFAKGWHCRPMLDIPRSSIQAYAEEHKLSWIDDSSNYDINIRRNFLRHHILPQLQNHWPQATAVITRSARHCADAQQQLDKHHLLLFKQAAGSQPDTLSVRKLLQYELSDRLHCLRFWLRQRGCTMPSEVKLRHIDSDVLQARVDAQPIVAWQDAQVCRYLDNLFVLPRQTHFQSFDSLDWDIKQSLSLPNNLGSLQAIPKVGEGLRVPEDVNLQIRWRLGGERFKPHGASHSKPLKKWLQLWQVPPWQREYIPLVYWRDELVQVVGYAISAAHAAVSDEPGVLVAWER